MEFLGYGIAAAILWIYFRSVIDRKRWFPFGRFNTASLLLVALLFLGLSIYFSLEIKGINAKYDSEIQRLETKPQIIPSPGSFIMQSEGRYASILKDTLTGCYFILSNSGTLSPRNDSTGRQICKR